MVIIYSLLSILQTQQGQILNHEKRENGPSFLMNGESTVNPSLFWYSIVLFGNVGSYRFWLYELKQFCLAFHINNS
jgi:hypothetical protein